MDLSHFHFLYPFWLWGLLVPPLAWSWYYLFNYKNCPSQRLEQFIDKHLLPYLLLNSSGKKRSLWKTLLLWSLIWLLLTLAIAGPRWNFKEVELFSHDQSIVILLDLSQSMDITDQRPSRLVRAKQKAEDLLNHAHGVKIGLIAFAADPHMITPLTEDVETVRHLLPSLDTSLVYVQGSKLSPALEMASNTLAVNAGNNQAIVVISDGGFEDGSAIMTAKKLADKGVVIHTIGVGTAEGAPVYDRLGKLIKRGENPVLSKLEEEKLRAISQAGNGYYFKAHYSDEDINLVLQELKNRAEQLEKNEQVTRLWDERFYLFVFPVMLIILWWFRRGVFISTVVLLMTTAGKSDAFELSDYFKNSEEFGKQALETGDFETATNSFQDPYRKGIAYYRKGDFAEAEALFRQSSREEVACEAAYNLGNALAQQQKFKEAVTAYEELLEQYPDHTKAKENLELIKKMLEEQQDQNQNQSEKDSEEPSSEEKEQNPEQTGESQDENEKEQTSEQTGESQDENEKEQTSEQTGESQGEEEKEPLQQLKSEEEQDADQLLNRLMNDPKDFLKNKFYLESKQKGTKEAIDPW